MVGVLHRFRKGASRSCRAMPLSAWLPTLQDSLFGGARRTLPGFPPSFLIGRREGFETVLKRKTMLDFTWGGVKITFPFPFFRLLF